MLPQFNSPREAEQWAISRFRPELKTEGRRLLDDMNQRYPYFESLEFREGHEDPLGSVEEAYKSLYDATIRVLNGFISADLIEFVDNNFLSDLRFGARCVDVIQAGAKAVFGYFPPDCVTFEDMPPPIEPTPEIRQAAYGLAGLGRAFLRFYYGDRITLYRVVVYGEAVAKKPEGGLLSWTLSETYARSEEFIDEVWSSFGSEGGEDLPFPQIIEAVMLKDNFPLETVFAFTPYGIGDRFGIGEMEAIIMDLNPLGHPQVEVLRRGPRKE